jgi:hypothetical protein
VTLVSPEVSLPLAGTTYPLGTTFAALRSVEHAFKEDVLKVQARILDMTLSEIAKLVSVGTGVDEEKVGQLLLDEVDVSGVEYQLLKARLMGWLAIALAPKADREKKSAAVADMLNRLATPASRGKSTKPSASAS